MPLICWCQDALAPLHIWLLFWSVLGKNQTNRSHPRSSKLESLAHGFWNHTGKGSCCRSLPIVLNSSVPSDLQLANTFENLPPFLYQKELNPVENLLLILEGGRGGFVHLVLRAFQKSGLRCYGWLLCKHICSEVINYS